MRDEAYPWDDEPRVMREFKHSWRGMPLRTDWNNRPFLRDCPLCPSCGYRFYDHCFVYRGGVLVNGKPAPLMQHQICWNCFMWDSDPGRMEACFTSMERTTAVGTAKRTPELKMVGGGR